MAEQEKIKSGSNATPLVIIGLIAIATILGIWWVSQSGGSGSGNTQTSNTSDANSKPQQEVASRYSKAPPGAVPERFKGSPSALVVVEEFADFQCGACAAKHSVFNEINSIYGSRIKFVFRHFPLTTQHAKAYDAATAAEAAGLQNKFWEMQNQLFQNQSKWMFAQNYRELFEQYAKTIGLDVGRFTSDNYGLNAKGRVDADMRRGNSIGINSTPSVFINGKPVIYEQMTVAGMRALIDAEFERLAPKKEDSEEDKDADSKEGADKKDAESETSSDDKESEAKKE